MTLDILLIGSANLSFLIPYISKREYILYNPIDIVCQVLYKINMQINKITKGKQMQEKRLTLNTEKRKIQPQVVSYKRQATLDSW